MKRFEYQQIDYSQYPYPEELNEEGDDGLEMICMNEITKKYFDTELVSPYSKNICRFNTYRYCGSI